METVARSKQRRSLEDEEEEELTDRISRLPDAVLGDIVTLLPTRDGARTQELSSRWRHIWRSAPLNLDLVRLTSFKYSRCVRVSASEITWMLSAHRGPGRRFCTELQHLELHDRCPAAVLDGWLRSPALDNLEELEFHYGFSSLPPRPQLPASVQRFSSTLRVAKFAGCSFPVGNAGALHLPVLKQLSLMDATISESSLQALLGGCPALQSLLLSDNSGYSRELVDDFISGLPDAILGDIVTLLPTRDGTRTQVLSSRWHHVWRSAPLNLDSNADSPRTIRGNIRDSEISRALSAHQGPGRRFLHEFPYIDT
ncbi:putative F-box/FBD/LRR-repeat protein At2g05300 [Setaria italica]|uniref:putative F-box/FBD/LRR-repeat protein At2g05300 n=1 Tax=Setaria italica TaxID=4555 RepID=UPI000350ABC4|nr:putative F-box/FBD/LRR-repeat protein At2g05300 [Setaria italica]